MSWKSWDFPLQYRDFLHLKSDFPHLKSNFPHTKSDFPQSAFYFLQWLSAFFDSFPLSSMAFCFLQWLSDFFQRLSDFLQQLSDFPRNPRKSIYGNKYTKDHYLSFVFFATCFLSFIISATIPNSDPIGGCRCWGSLGSLQVVTTIVLLLGIATPLTLLPLIQLFLLFLHCRNLPPLCHRSWWSLHQQPCWYSTVSFALVVQSVRSVLVCEACGGICSLLLLWPACQIICQRLLLIESLLVLRGPRVWRRSL